MLITGLLQKVRKISLKQLLSFTCFQSLLICFPPQHFQMILTCLCNSIAILLQRQVHYFLFSSVLEKQLATTQDKSMNPFNCLVHNKDIKANKIGVSLPDRIANQASVFLGEFSEVFRVPSKTLMLSS